MVQLACVIVAVAFAWFTMRRVDENLAWALGSIAWLLMTPLVWSHYLWVAVGATALAVASHRDRTANRRLAVTLPLVALLMSTPVIFGAETTFWDLAIPLPVSSKVWDWYRPLSLVGIALVIASITRGGRRETVSGATTYAGIP